MPQNPSDWVTVNSEPDDWTTIDPNPTPASPQQESGGWLDWWDNQWFNKPLSYLVTGGKSIAQDVGNWIDPVGGRTEDQWRIPEVANLPFLNIPIPVPGGGGTYRSLLGGMGEGLTNVGESLSTPLNIATAGAGSVYSRAAKTATTLPALAESAYTTAPKVANAARQATRALSAPVIATGAGHTLQGIEEGDWANAAFGIAEMAGGGAGSMLPRINAHAAPIDSRGVRAPGRPDPIRNQPAPIEKAPDQFVNDVMNPAGEAQIAPQVSPELPGFNNGNWDVDVGGQPFHFVDKAATPELLPHPDEIYRSLSEDNTFPGDTRDAKMDSRSVILREAATRWTDEELIQAANDLSIDALIRKQHGTAVLPDKWARRKVVEAELRRRGLDARMADEPFTDLSPRPLPLDPVEQQFLDSVNRGRLPEPSGIPEFDPTTLQGLQPSPELSAPPTQGTVNWNRTRSSRPPGMQFLDPRTGEIKPASQAAPGDVPLTAETLREILGTTEAPVADPNFMDSMQQAGASEFSPDLKLDNQPVPETGGTSPVVAQPSVRTAKANTLGDWINQLVKDESGEFDIEALTRFIRRDDEPQRTPRPRDIRYDPTTETYFDRNTRNWTDVPDATHSEMLRAQQINRGKPTQFPVEDPPAASVPRVKERDVPQFVRDFLDNYDVDQLTDFIHGNQDSPDWQTPHGRQALDYARDRIDRIADGYERPRGRSAEAQAFTRNFDYDWDTPRPAGNQLEYNPPDRFDQIGDESARDYSNPQDVSQAVRDYFEDASPEFLAEYIDRIDGDNTLTPSDRQILEYARSLFNQFTPHERYAAQQNAVHSTTNLELMRRIQEWEPSDIRQYASGVLRERLNMQNASAHWVDPSGNTHDLGRPDIPAGSYIQVLDSTGNPVSNPNYIPEQTYSSSYDYDSGYDSSYEANNPYNTAENKGKSLDEVEASKRTPALERLGKLIGEDRANQLSSGETQIEFSEPAVRRAGGKHKRLPSGTIKSWNNWAKSELGHEQSRYNDPSKTGIEVIKSDDPGYFPDHFKIMFRDNNGKVIGTLHTDMTGRGISLLAVDPDMGLRRGKVAFAMLKEAFDRGVHEPSGSVSDFTRNLIERVKRLAKSESGELDLDVIYKAINDMIDTVANSRFGQAVGRFVRDEGGGANTSRLEALFKKQQDGTITPQELAEAKTLAKEAAQTKANVVDPAVASLQERLNKASSNPDPRMAANDIRELVDEATEVLNKMPEGPEKVGLIRQVIGANKSILTAYDFSAPGRQGKAFILNPEYWKSMGSMFKAWGSEKGAQLVNDSIRDHKSGYFRKPVSETGRVGKSFAEKAGLDLTATEEMFHRTMARTGAVTKAAAKIPGLERSSRAHTAFLNKLRADMFASMMEKAKMAGLDPERNMHIAKKYAEFINDATGRGSLNIGKWKLERNVTAMNDLFFAPKNMAGQIRTWKNVLNLMNYAGKDPVMRKQALRSLFAVAGLGSLVAEGAKMAGAKVMDDVTDYDMVSSDFMKIKIGDTRLDLFGGYQQFPVAAAKLILGKTKPSTGDNAGRLMNLDGSTPYRTRIDPAERFFINRLSPLASFIYAWGSGKEFDGKPFEAKRAAFERTFPIAAKDIYELALEDPQMAALLAVPIEFGWINAQHYSGR